MMGSSSSDGTGGSGRLRDDDKQEDGPHACHSGPPSPPPLEEDQRQRKKTSNNRLMLVVGERDENVDPAATMQLVGALQHEGLDHDLVVAIGYGHGACDHCPFARRKRTQFLLKHLGGARFS